MLDISQTAPVGCRFAATNCPNAASASASGLPVDAVPFTSWVMDAGETSATAAFFRVHKVCIQTRHHRFRQRITDQCISSRTGKTDQFFRQYRNGRHFRMTEGDGFKIKLRQGSGLTLPHPAGSTTGHLGMHADIERHLTKCRDPALTKSPDNGLRTQVINKVLRIFLVFRQAACPLRVRGGSCPPPPISEHGADDCHPDTDDGPLPGLQIGRL